MIKFLFISAIIFSTGLANTAPTTVSDIKNQNIICYHITKSEALVFKTTKPQRVWRTTQNREGHIKTAKALQLGQSELKLAAKSIESFQARIAKGYLLKGSFTPNSDKGLSLTVNFTYIPDGNTSTITDHYNCNVIN